MKYLRQYMRHILKEDLGEKVWADRAPIDSRHHGTEPDTEAEYALWNQLGTYMMVNNPMNDIGMIKKIRQYMHDPRYNDVFITGKNPEVFRGQVVNRKTLEEVIGSNIPNLLDVAEEINFHGYYLMEVLIST